MMTAEEYITRHWEPNEVWRHLEWPRHQTRLRTCAENVVGNRFLDVGCAFGHSTHIMSKHRDGEWAGADFSRTAVDRARREFPALTFYYVGAIDSFPVCGDADTIVCSGVIEHAEDDKALLQAMVDAARRRVIVTTPAQQVNDPGHLRLYNRSALINLADNAQIHNWELWKDNHSWYMILNK